MTRALFLSALLILGAACTKVDQGLKVSKLTMLDQARKIEPTVDVLLPKDLNSGVKCRSEGGEMFYGPGCLHAFQVKVGDVDLVAVEFENEELARAEAVRLKQYYYANWVLDDVAGEPSLERFVKEAFGAKGPKDLPAK